MTPGKITTNPFHTMSRIAQSARESFSATLSPLYQMTANPSQVQTIHPTVSITQEPPIDASLMANPASISTTTNPFVKFFDQSKIKIENGPPWQRNVLKYGSYWAVMGGSLLSTYAGLKIGIPDEAIIFALSSAVFSANWALENLITYREDWQPDSQQMKVDTLHYLISNGILPAIFKGLVMGTVYSWGSQLASYAVGQSLWQFLSGDTFAMGSFVDSDLSLLLTFPAALLIAEFIYYWVHRSFHEVSILWPIHKLHHSLEKMNGFGAARNHPFNSLASFGLVTIVLALIGTPNDPYTLATAMTALHSILQHGNADLDLGKGEAVISSPKLHRIHHSTKVDADGTGVVPDEGNSNFGNTLIIWDRIFGTYYRPKDYQGPEQVGIIDAEGNREAFIDPHINFVRNYWDHFTYPFKEIYGMLVSKAA